MSRSLQRLHFFYGGRLADKLTRTAIPLLAQQFIDEVRGSFGRGIHQLAPVVIQAPHRADVRARSSDSVTNTLAAGLPEYISVAFAAQRLSQPSRAIVG